MCVCFVTAPSESEGLRLAEGLVQARLVACVNLLDGVQSVYVWENKVCRDKEVLLIGKTQKRHVSAIEAFLQAEHPYDVHELITMPIEDGSPPYLEWLLKSTP